MSMAQYSGLDYWLAHYIYQFNVGWVLKEHWLVETVIHRGGRYLTLTVFVGLLLSAALSYVPRFKHIYLLVLCRYLALSTALAIFAVSMLKQYSSLPCPWDITLFGGSRPDIKIHQVFSSQQALGHYFPSGHASGGYAFFSFYFACLIAGMTDLVSVPTRWQKLMLMPGLMVGLTFGFAQQLRGAHFLSHDIASAAVCWLVCGLTAYLFSRKTPSTEEYYASLTQQSV